MRADVFLVESGHASTRSQAQRLIGAGVEWRLGPGAPWTKVAKNGDDMPPGAELRLLDAAEARFVSRGGLKLDGALESLGLPVQAEIEVFDGATDGVQQSGAAARGVGGGGELRHVRQAQGGHGHLVLVVKLHEGEAGLSGDFELGFQEVIEGGDGGLLHGLHGAGAIKDVGDFGEVWFHEKGCGCGFQIQNFRTR